MSIRRYVGAMSGAVVIAMAAQVHAQVPDFCGFFGLAVSGPVSAAGDTAGLPFPFAPEQPSR